MADFEKAYAVVRKNEGGYVNNPNDKGGETYKGIAFRSWPYWAGWRRINEINASFTPPASMKQREDLMEADMYLQQLVHDFFRINFWDSLNLNLVTSQVIAAEIFDTAVNMGLSTAGKFVQRALNVSNKNGKLYPDVTVDGQIGPKTILMINNHPDRKILLKTLNMLQGEKYISICEADRTQEMFYYGWMERVMEQWAINVVL